LKSREKIIFLKVVALFSLWFLISLSLFYYFFETAFFHNSLLVFAVIVLFSVAGGYFISFFALKPMFEKNEALDELLKDTLHELNIPISTIKANVSMLKKREKDPKNMKRLERIEEASEKLFSLYEEVDYMIKKEIERASEEMFDAKEVIENEIPHFLDIQKDIEIKSELFSCVVYADRRGFVKMFDNLLSNAIKYNKKGGFVKIVLRDCRLVIEDSGIGMSEEEIFKIFDRYYQSDSNKKGYGIGLHIVKSYCDENMIGLSIKSEKGVGTKFILDLAKIKV